MTHTSDEIKRGLWCCTHNGGCDACPYRDISVGCRPARNADALALIKQLESDKQQLEGMLAHMNQLRDAAAGRALKMEKRAHQLEAERDAAVADMHEAQGCLCLICKNHKPDPEKKKYICKAFGDYPFEDGPLICGKFEWRGVQKEE